VDALRRDDIERARAASPEEKARQAFDAMRTGIRLKRAALRERDPQATAEQIEQRLQRWLERDE
jgi:kynureninase